MLRAFRRSNNRATCSSATVGREMCRPPIRTSLRLGVDVGASVGSSSAATSRPGQQLDQQRQLGPSQIRQVDARLLLAPPASVPHLAPGSSRMLLAATTAMRPSGRGGVRPGSDSLRSADARAAALQIGWQRLKRGQFRPSATVSASPSMRRLDPTAPRLRRYARLRRAVRPPS